MLREPDLWEAVERYADEATGVEDPVLAAALADSERAGLPSIQVTPAQGKFLHLLARAVRARRILEIGTLGGYSTIWLARALPPDGRLVTLEINPRHASVARANLTRAGLESRVEIRLGPALDSLERMEREGEPPFDFTFIDADKPPYREYLLAAVRRSRPGALLVVDNVVWEGEILDPASPDPAVQGIRRMYAELPRIPHLAATTLQTVGPKKHDGFLVGLVTGP